MCRNLLCKTGPCEFPERYFIRRLIQSNGGCAKRRQRIALVAEPPLDFAGPRAADCRESNDVRVCT
jgi:hypothetical protein